MPGVALGETVNTTNPLITFVYRANGLLTDVAELSLEIRDAESGATRLAETVLSLAAAPGGTKLGTGRYAPTFTATATGATAWSAGTHVAIWRYRLVLAGTQYTTRQRFEVLSPDEFAQGAGYVGYAASFELRRSTPFSTMPIATIQRAIDEASRRVELWTGRFFEPRYLSFEIDGTGGKTLALGYPVIAIDTVYELGTGPADQLFEIDRDALRVYNRHLAGMLDPDDRDNPKIEYSTNVLPGSVLYAATFSPGNQNVQLNGMFGYTDPDGTPLGCTPRMLSRIVGIVAGRQALDPLGLDSSVSAPGRIKSARTRDQAVTYETGSGSSGGANVFTGAVTGDRVLDDYLIQLMRPPHLGSA